MPTTRWNQTLSLRRRDLELLEAILTNCLRLGPESQNRAARPNFRAHLEGRIGFVEMINSPKGRRLRSLFQDFAVPDLAIQRVWARMHENIPRFRAGGP